MTPRTLAWRTVVAKPARAALAVVGVTVIGALLFDMLMLSKGLLISFRDQLDTAGYDVRVLSSAGLPIERMPIENASVLMDEIARRQEVREAVMVRRDRAVVAPEKAPAVRVILLGVSGGADRVWRLTAGENLNDAARASPASPIVLSGALARLLAVGPGAIVRVRVTPAGSASAIPAAAFRVAGIAEFDLEPSDDYLAATTIEAARHAQGEGAKDEADLVLVASRAGFDSSTTAAALGSLRPDVRAYSNEQLVAQFNQNGFAYFRQISFVLSAITLTFVFLLIATLLSVSVNHRLREVAALRAVGVPRSRIAAALIWEAAWLVGAGGLLSLPVGWLIAIELDRILRSMPGFPQRLHFFVLEPAAIGQHLSLLAVAAIASAIYPVWVATRLPIASTLRRETIS